MITAAQQEAPDAASFSVVHLVSNHKFTGPVDPALVLYRALEDLGVRSRLGVGRPRDRERGPVQDVIDARGIDTISELELPKHRRLFANLRDRRRLTDLLRRDPADILHAHLDNAHETALRVKRALGGRIRRGSEGGAAPLVVRTLYDGDAPPLTPRYERLYGPVLDGVFVFGERLREDLIARFGLPPERVVRIHGAVSTERFYPRAPEETLRDRFGLPARALVVGIVARIQRHRRYSVLLEAIRRVVQDVPELRLLVLGRGTHARELAHEPARELGIAEQVCLPGYVGGEDYPRALACFDMKVFLVPGSDGTCRAVREAMATGIPMIVSKRGLLPEMVRHEKEGLVVEDDVEGLATAIRRLATDSALRRRLGANALQRAREEFDLGKQASKVLEMYRRWRGAVGGGETR